MHVPTQTLKQQPLVPCKDGEKPGFHRVKQAALVQTRKQKKRDDNAALFKIEATIVPKLTETRPSYSPQRGFVTHSHTNQHRTKSTKQKKYTPAHQIQVEATETLTLTHQHMLTRESTSVASVPHGPIKTTLTKMKKTPEVTHQTQYKRRQPKHRSTPKTPKEDKKRNTQSVRRPGTKEKQWSCCHCGRLHRSNISSCSCTLVDETVPLMSKPPAPTQHLHRNVTHTRLIVVNKSEKKRTKSRLRDSTTTLYPAGGAPNAM